MNPAEKIGSHADLCIASNDTGTATEKAPL